MYLSSPQRRPSKKDTQARAAIAARFKVLCLDAGLKTGEVAQALHVTERTVYAWFSGKTAVPYSAYRLLRILSRFELPGRGWEGWHMHSGKLWTPEGFGFEPVDAQWWSLIVRQARCFRAAYERSAQLEKALMALGAEGQRVSASLRRADPLARSAEPTGPAPGAARSAGLNLFISHITTHREQRHA